MQKPRNRWLLVFLGVVCVVALIVVLWRNEPHLPSSITSLELKRSLKGAEASAMIDHLHNKGVTPQSNLIGIYAGKQGSAVVYMSLYSSDAEVKNALEEMRSRISSGNPIFDHYSETKVRGHQVSSCLGQGQTHYFFSHEKQLYWLAVDSQVAPEAVEDLVRSVAGEK
jgi:hypothetical protein